MVELADPTSTSGRKGVGTSAWGPWLGEAGVETRLEGTVAPFRTTRNPSSGIAWGMADETVRVMRAGRLSQPRANIIARPASGTPKPTLWLTSKPARLVRRSGSVKSK